MLSVLYGASAVRIDGDDCTREELTTNINPLSDWDGLLESIVVFFSDVDELAQLAFSISVVFPM